MSSVNASRADDPRTLATRAMLVESTEALIGDYGVNGVSIRQISKASGSANSSVIAYHFGNKDALLKAVIEYRLPAIDARRMVLLDRAKANSAFPDMSMLVDALYRPFFEQRDSLGRRSYAAFVAELIRANQIDIRMSLNADFPATRELLDHIDNHIGNRAYPPFGHRVALASAVIFAALRQIDHACAGEEVDEVEFVIALQAATAVLEVTTIAA